MHTLRFPVSTYDIQSFPAAPARTPAIDRNHLSSKGNKWPAQRKTKPLTAPALRAVLTTIETRILYALERQNAALLTIAAHIAMSSASSREQDLTPVLTKAIVTATFEKLLKP